MLLPEYYEYLSIVSHFKFSYVSVLDPVSKSQGARNNAWLALETGSKTPTQI